MKPLIQTTDLYLAFGGVVAADNINFELHEGERLAVIGQNGAGKTTFINICTGYLTPSKGKVYFDGKDVTAMAPRKIVRLGMGRSFQLPQLFTEHTVRQCVQIAAARRNKELSWFRSLESTIDAREVDATLDLVGLLPDADEACIELPEGKRKLLDVAMALALQPKLLIMDEPTSGVASEDKFALMETVMHALDERRVTSWFVEHDVDIVSRYATRVAAWIAGKVAADGSPEDVLNNPQIRSEVLGA
ncbi:ATP-binding cassette domain-containing protein [Achromobacter mucicolens]|jgi:branched-chain amino acid transport system ATP-binding protein|uniref:ATP-binding cassette domain-containing protein n=1 Tax=Achromobacter mucicolens TaxID=1389922 RepID=A0ABD4YPQ9_9BURK|nr:MULTISPECIES: ATP-binding cassette domain-containing protein [Achromobacter]KXJ65683.1 ABC transporter ATP-binding protein [Achromobacter xylosoxidans]OXC89592.1 ABC transporter ATP-binding protein [Achromobacter sp. KAs 3-5]KRB10511.1 ABC transporter ATP-binding protein [Achromobacter sp. Root170]MCP2517538.1 ATP-binding cassette domain-containing protein [Achromobacter mucicolens]MCU6615636.1 ATP-binding cassette domain-containing protein [Achromobacter mucicolens]